MSLCQKGCVNGSQRAVIKKKVREVGHQTQLEPDIETILAWVICSTHSTYCSEKAINSPVKQKINNCILKRKQKKKSYGSNVS